MVPSELDASALGAVTWFDLFDYPLTYLELEQWRMKVPSDIDQQIPPPSFVQGFYCIPGREYIIRTRLGRLGISHQKFHKACRAAQWFACVPFVRMVAVANTLGWNNAQAGSDIDFFIVAQKGRVWWVRFATTVIAHIAGWRPWKGHTADSVCLSFFVGTDVLNLHSLTHPEATQKWPFDIYLSAWVNQLTLLYNEANCYEHFVQANTWCTKLFPFIQERVTVARRMVGISVVTVLCKRAVECVFVGFIGDRGEAWLMHLQSKYLPTYLKEKVGKGTDVVVTASVAKFHGLDRRMWYRDVFLKRYAAITQHH